MIGFRDSVCSIFLRGSLCSEVLEGLNCVISIWSESQETGQVFLGGVTGRGHSLGKRETTTWALGRKGGAGAQRHWPRAKCIHTLSFRAGVAPAGDRLGATAWWSVPFLLLLVQERGAWTLSVASLTQCSDLGKVLLWESRRWRPSPTHRNLWSWEEPYKGKEAHSGTRGSVTWVCRAQRGHNSGTRTFESVYMGGERRWLSRQWPRQELVLRITYSKEWLGAGPIWIQYRNSLDPNRPKDVGSGEGWWTQLWELMIKPLTFWSDSGASSWKRTQTSQ